MALHRDTVVVHPTGSTSTTDDDGQPTFAPGADVVLTGAQVGPAAVRVTTTAVADEEPVTGRWRVSTAIGDLHPDDITEGDQVSWQGGTYWVQGLPMTYYGVRAHTEFLMSTTRG